MTRVVIVLACLLFIVGCDSGSDEAAFCSPNPPVGSFQGEVETTTIEALTGLATIDKACGSICYWRVRLEDETGWMIWIPRHASRYDRDIPPPLPPGIYTHEDPPGPVLVSRDGSDYDVDAWRLDLRQDTVGNYRGEFQMQGRFFTSSDESQEEYEIRGCFHVEDNEAP